MRCRAQEQLVLTLLCDLADRDRALCVHRVATAARDDRRARRCDMMGLVDHEDVECVPLTGLGVGG